MSDAGTAALPWEQPLGAIPGDGSVTYRVWAPAATRVELELAGGTRHPLTAVEPAALGVWEATLPGGHGDDYRFVLDGTAWPDPCSRWQPEGIRGPSRVLDPGRLSWAAERPALDPATQILYELHVGAFTPEGTFGGAIQFLPALADLGVTAIELMPIGEFPGRRGWGYDGVYPGAAQSTYGGPEALARLVDAAHAHGLGVVLDVVYNHIGASGTPAYDAFGPYFTEKYRTPWGRSPNFDDAGCGAVREWVLQSAEHWVRDLHVDGLRVDALHSIVDTGARHLLAELTERVRAIHPGALLIAESGLNDPRTIRPVDEGGWGFGMDWADDFHHALLTCLTDDRDGWYADYGSPEQLAATYVEPYLFAGDYVPFRGRRHGAPAEDRPVEQFVVFDQNHDQVGNRALGDRLPREVRAIAALCLLFHPATPMLFMGEEYGEDAPFQFFTDHIDASIAEATREGRRAEFARFAEFSGQEVPDPQDPGTFRRSILTRHADPELAALYRNLVHLRRGLPPGRAEATWNERGVRVRRGSFEMIANLTDGTVDVRHDGTEVIVSAGTIGEGEGSMLRLGPYSGAVVR
jgi:maltooligosyltrehalose trehalohydrolase